MNKYLFGAGVGVLLLIGLSYAHATVFSAPTNPIVTPHHYTATDNGDSCVTPEEIAGFRKDTGGFEKIGSYSSPEDIQKLKEGIVKHYPGSKMEDMTWDMVDAYVYNQDDGTKVVLVTIYAKGADGLECANGGGPGSLEEWNAVVEAGGLAPVASDLHAGNEGDGGAKLLIHKGHID